MVTIYDVYTHPAGASFEESVADALTRFQAWHGCDPVAVWASPLIESAGDTVAGLPLICSRHMNPWYVYLELPPQLPAVIAGGGLFMESSGDSAAAELGPAQPALFPESILTDSTDSTAW